MRMKQAPVQTGQERTSFANSLYATLSITSGSLRRRALEGVVGRDLLPNAPVHVPKILGLVAPYRPNASRDKSFDTSVVPALNVALRTTSQLLIASPLLT